MALRQQPNGFLHIPIRPCEMAPSVGPSTLCLLPRNLCTHKYLNRTRTGIDNAARKSIYLALTQLLFPDLIRTPSAPANSSCGRPRRLGILLFWGDFFWCGSTSLPGTQGGPRPFQVRFLFNVDYFLVHLLIRIAFRIAPLVSPTHKRTEGRAPVGALSLLQKLRTTGGIQRNFLLDQNKICAIW
jgi:hypothetical protein